MHCHLLAKQHMMYKQLAIVALTISQHAILTHMYVVILV